jgi:excinuclease ABC subunit C
MKDEQEKDIAPDDLVHEDLKEKARAFPTDPGVYLMRNEGNTIIYVGKAKNLRNRVRSYFTGEKDIKTRVMIGKVRRIEYIITNTEYEALLLENNLIKQWKPRYNINLKDGKTYPVIRITNEEFPRIFRTRKVIQDGSQYFGPYPDVRSIDRYLELIERLFPLRKCRGPIKKRGRPCLYYHMGRCSGACAGLVSREEYMRTVDRIRKLLSGETDELVRDLEARMREAVTDLRFEKAAYYRDAIQAIRSLEDQQVEDFDLEARDYAAFAARDGRFSFVVFQMRSGKLLGRDVFRNEALGSEPEMLEQFLVQYYGAYRKPPAKLYLPIPIDTETVKSFFRFELGSEVEILLPESSRDESILRMAAGNAQEDLSRMLEEQEDLPGLKDLAELLNLPAIPKRIEGFDIAQLNGKFPVASMVSFLSGKPDRAKYRKFHIKTLNGAIDDFEAMREVVARRYTRVMNEGLERPGLILIDGGKGQVNAAVGMLELLGLEIPVAGLAKRNEEIFLPGRKDPVILPEGSPALRILQHVRDEAHRFATGFNKRLRGKTVAFTLLENVRGIGRVRSRKLLDLYESVEGILSHEPAEIAAEVGIPFETAERVIETLKKADMSAADDGSSENGLSPVDAEAPGAGPRPEPDPDDGQAPDAE